MKPKKSPLAQASTILATILVCGSAHAANLYWDTNGATVGSGAPTGTWGTDSFWSTDSTGASATGAYVAGSDVFFSAGTAGAGTAGIVTVSGTQSVKSITFNQLNPNNVTLNGGTLDFGSTQGVISLNAGSATALSIGTINSLITGTGGLSFSSAAAGSNLTLTGANVGLSGPVSISTGELGINNANALGTGTITVSSGTFHIGPGANNLTVANAIQIAGAGANGRGALRMSGGSTVTGGVSLTANANITAVNAAATISGPDLSLGTFAATIGFVNNGSLTISSKITGSGALNINGVNSPTYNILSLTNTNNTFTGGVNIVNAGVALGNDTALGTGTLTLSGGGGVNSPRIQSTDATTRTISNALAISGTNAANVLAFGASTSPTGTALTGTGDLIFSNTTTTNLGTVARTFQIDNATTEFKAGFSGAGPANGDPVLTKTGLGTMLLSGASTYTGVTSIKTGTLKLSATGSINNTLGVIVASGAKFDVSAKGTSYTVNGIIGNGQVIGGINVTTTLAAGDLSTVGTLSLNNLSLAVSSAMYHDITSGSNSADLINVTGDIALNGAALTLNQLGAYTAGQKFTLFAYTGTLTGTFSGHADNSTFTDAGGQWLINYHDTTAGVNGGLGNSFVTLTAVPEPSIFLLGNLGLLALLRRRRH